MTRKTDADIAYDYLATKKVPEKYAGKWIAVYRTKIVASAKMANIALQKAMEKTGKPSESILLSKEPPKGGYGYVIW